jgi:hypothetical protein
MQRSWIAVGTLAVSCLLAGCDSPTTAPPDEVRAAIDVVKQKQPPPQAAGKSGAPASHNMKTKK